MKRPVFPWLFVKQGPLVISHCPIRVSPLLSHWSAFRQSQAGILATALQQGASVVAKMDRKKMDFRIDNPFVILPVSEKDPSSGLLVNLGRIAVSNNLARAGLAWEAFFVDFQDMHVTSDVCVRPIIDNTSLRVTVLTNPESVRSKLVDSQSQPQSQPQQSGQPFPQPVAGLGSADSGRSQPQSQPQNRRQTQPLDLDVLLAAGPAPVPSSQLGKHAIQIEQGDRADVMVEANIEEIQVNLSRNDFMLLQVSV